mmetsp:Transcript_1945/g.4095  ORF Transcript_1945/g.4095 Transcript_1945/m.4095 type:complete len:186 (+) Transcript_1945:138-695(+)
MWRVLADLDLTVRRLSAFVWHSDHRRTVLDILLVVQVRDWYYEFGKKTAKTKEESQSWGEKYRDGVKLTVVVVQKCHNVRAFTSVPLAREEPEEDEEGPSPPSAGGTEGEGGSVRSESIRWNPAAKAAAGGGRRPPMNTRFPVVYNADNVRPFSVVNQQAHNPPPARQERREVRPSRFSRVRLRI